MFAHLVFDHRWVKALIVFYAVIIFLSMIAGGQWTGTETFIALCISSIIAFKMIDRDATIKKVKEIEKKRKEDKKDD